MSIKRKLEVPDKETPFKSTFKRYNDSDDPGYQSLNGFMQSSDDKLKPALRRIEIIRDGKMFPVFHKPSVTGVFSIDANRKLALNGSQIKYFYWTKANISASKNVNYDLNENIKNCVHKDKLLNEKLHHIFSWLKAEGNQKEECQKADFICFRGLLTAVMSTPYEQQEGWIICAEKINNTIFLCAFDTEKKKREKENENEKQKIFQSWGYKFEQYMLAEEPGQEPDTKKPVVESEEFACIFRSKLNSHNLLYVAEMDGVVSDEPVDSTMLKTNNVPFIELKTSRHIETQRQDRNFKRFKLLKWWCQSFLVGIENIYCGFRDDNGIVSVIKEFRVRDLPKMAKGLWDPCVCMNFCAQFLDFVKACVTECPNSLWKFEWTPGNFIMGQEMKSHSEFAFVPEWYFSAV